ncbi:MULTISPECIES: FMN-dependent NADH-azoreductase [Paraburkholderia]|uniref:FMN-dependent NADH-azoreductase n=1 Tax=Paraburkholderia TaxID=1822464 RepID=UPI00224CF0E9|nr:MULTISPECIES: NAD(P)H-dependent oxidoreductase [Paraburkholderia]MCX4163161.1 NAD(P)H-dependent oxidoreductase [Paraburkholderia megapolitana]MDN7158657.1 NAD(P)H-dependent oxidoreductase [Paraburkholderia sp. CHISQ3]MDQ6495704.1 NAD(P)H-dependent oxidoreductase [Paraburkholderia megapolitana]
MKLLHIDSSILGQHSVSRVLTSEIVARQVELHPGIDVIYRDLANDALLHLSGAHLAVFQGAAVSDAALGTDLATGGAYLDELFAADIIVIGAPMYNFSVSSQLKAWIDRVVVAGKSFKYGEKGPEGLLPKSKKVFVASSRGGVYSGGSPAAIFDHHETYLTGVLSFIGLTDITIVRAEGLNLGPDAKDASIATALADIAALAA